MKMDWTDEELLARAEDAGELLRKTLELLITQYKGDLTLKHMTDARNQVFYDASRSFERTIQKGGYSYDFEQIGRLTHYLYDHLEVVWLEYVL